MVKFRKRPTEPRRSPNFATLRAWRPGWTCPACGKGNAPDVKGCVHCTTTGNGYLWASGKLSVVKVNMR
jgi:uncharacterized OB-fold protein